MDSLTLGKYLLLLPLFVGFTVLPFANTDGNSTAHPETTSPPCPQYTEDCTELSPQSKWSGHFSRCPKTYRHYCIKGKCRFVTEENIPACICDLGYTGARCEYFDLFYLKGDRRHYIVIGLIVALMALIILIVGICICTHFWKKTQRKKRKEKEGEGRNNNFTTKMEETQLV
ncbi:probetacellulin isoform X2 [Xenopus laevis]|uniref:Probetacellulin n=1 Tax=Xenopus laevis TaxID=8355 RepID=A0A8J0U8M0_XENLA|nr:probetacellulin isoform X1 [Xenopus laevis]XP_018098937.1 probetacellulin isoform X1 [Xenopus laevis]XP_041435633.1 probetacellulin isoform X2 [Xenopus laevis]